MDRAWRVGRAALLGLGVVAAVLLVLRVGAGWYLHSSGGRAVVANRIGAAIGLPVEVGALSVGPEHSTIAFRVLDPALGSSPEAEVLGVESASADVSFAELVTGRVRPSEVKLRGVAVSLQLDSSGRLITTLPTPPESTGPVSGPFPTITVEGGRVTVRQEGRPAFTIGNVTLHAAPQDGKVKLSGTAADPAWGNWTLAGEFDPAAGAGWVEAGTDDGPVKLDLLRTIPYIPAPVWDHVQPAGRGKATVRVTVGPAPAHAVGYDVRVRPTDVAVGIPAAEVTLQKARGIVRVHDGKVDIGGAADGEAATAELAGGTVKVGGRYDFDATPSVADPIRVAVDKLAVKELPAKWGLKTLGGKLPGKLSLDDGFLTGAANLKLLIHADGKVETFGGGTGSVALPNFLGGRGKIGVTLGGDGKRLDFRLGEPGANAGAGAEVAVNVGRRPGDAANVVPPTPPGDKGDSAPGPRDAVSSHTVLREVGRREHPSPLAGEGRGWGEGVGGVTGASPDGSTSPPVISAPGRARVVPPTPTPPPQGGRGDSAPGPHAHTSCATGADGPAPPPAWGKGAAGSAAAGWGEPPAAKSKGAVPAAAPGRLLAALVLLQPPEPKRADQTPIDATLSLRDVDIGQLVQQLDLKIPYTIAGKVTLKAKLTVPLGEAATAASYRLTGRLTSPELRFEGLTVRDAAAELAYQNGTLTLTELRGTVPDGDAAGTFAGTAKLAIDPPGDATADLVLTNLPVGPVAAGVPGLKLKAAGAVTGKATFRAPFDKLSDPATWAASATVTSDALTIEGRAIKGVSLAADLAKGVVTLKDAAATVEGIPVAAAGTLGLTGALKLDATVKATGATVTDLRRLVPELDLPVPVEGSLDAEAKLTGTLSPAAVSATGRVTAADLTLNKTSANHVVVRWELEPERFKVTELTARVFGGSLDGKLDYPLRPDRGGSFALGFKDLDAAAARSFVPDFPVRVTGAVTGTVAGTIPPAKDGARVGTLDLDLTAPKLTVQGFPAERLVGKAAVRGGAVEYSLEGHTLGGTFEVKGRYPGAKQDPPAKAGRGVVRFQNLDLSRLAPALRADALAPLAGRADLTFDYDNDLSGGAGRVFVRGLRWGTEATADEIAGVLTLSDGFLQLRDLSGYVAGGVLRGRARMNLDSPERNFFSVTLDRADARKLLAPLGSLGHEVDGHLSVVVRGNVGRSTRVSGSVTLDRGTVGGATLAGLRVPFEATAGAAGGHLVVREATALAGAGRTTGGVTIDWGGGAGVRVGGQVRLFDVPIRALAPSLGENAFVGSGRLTGRFDIAGQNVRAVDDLTGNLVGVLNGASVQEIPLLRQAVPYLNPVGVTRPFQNGDVRATLSGGVVRIQRLALANPSAQVFADGSITAATGRLDLDVTAHTGSFGPDVPGLRALGLRIPAFGPVPVTLIRDVTDFLSNRTVKLSITGTAAAPVVRVNAAALLRDEAVRFFLTRYVLPAGALGGIEGGTGR